MKQIVINADAETHAWLAELAKKECRTIGNQALVMLGIKRTTKPKTRKAKGGKA